MRFPEELQVVGTTPPPPPPPSHWLRRLPEAAAVGIIAGGVLGSAYWASTRPDTSSHPDCPAPPGLGMSFVKIEPGKFMMGSGSNQRAVTITKPFCMSRFEITQEQWQKITDSLPSQRKEGKDFPVGNVSWYDVQKFLVLLNRRYSGARYRLPTEAQWEYAARAGSSGNFHFEGEFDALPKYANCNRSREPAHVGSYRANPWGLYDMYGNISEWVADWWAPLPDGAVTDPTGPAIGSKKVRRGGSFDYGARCNSTFRIDMKPNIENDTVGFRVVRDPMK
ncbi:MAG TPA: formylglycine-generating enzyme family protein [Thermoanaerobaculia bacterium]